MILVSEVSIPPLSSWQTFYEIVGSSAGALIGLQFVVIALIVSTRRQINLESIGAFGTPTVVHFGGALAISAVVSAPWPSLRVASVVVGICGLAGLGYVAIVVRRARRQTEYRPVFEDWLWHAIMPCGAYVVLALAAFFLQSTQVAAYAVAGAALGLLFVGIHNSWDTVTYIISEQQDSTSSK